MRDEMRPESDQSNSQSNSNDNNYLLTQSCRIVMAAIYSFIDNEIEDSAQFNLIAFHLQECEPCAIRTEIERKQINLLRNLLTRSCNEVTPDDLEDRIVIEIHALAARMQTPGFFQSAFYESSIQPTSSIISQYRKTEIFIDGETTIEIEESHEIHREFPL